MAVSSLKTDEDVREKLRSMKEHLAICDVTEVDIFEMMSLKKCPKQVGELMKAVRILLDNSGHVTKVSELWFDTRRRLLSKGEHWIAHRIAELEPETVAPEKVAHL